MLKRLVAVITVKNNWVVQSVGFEKYYPLGRPEIFAENFDNWQVDEILVMDIDRTRQDLGPNFDLVKNIAAKNIMTPLCYVGGIRGVDDAQELIRCGADRIGMDSLFRVDPIASASVANIIGRQAVVRSQPFVRKSDGIYMYDYVSQKAEKKFELATVIESSNYFSELLLIDVANEGGHASFDEDVVADFHNIDVQLICFGGVTEGGQIARLYGRRNVSAVAVGNTLSYYEIANRQLLASLYDVTRSTTFGAVTGGARDW